MATTIPTRSNTFEAEPADISLALPQSGVRWPVRAVLVAATCVLVGIVWDISWHMSIGRDTLWSPPHLMTYAAGLIVGVTCGWLALHTTFRGTAEARGHSVAFWGFRAPLGAWICLWGAFAMLASAPFDDWWHQAYGLDVKIISPPHVVLALGMYAVVVGAMVMTAAARSDAPDARTRRRLEWGLVYALGVMLSMVAVFTTEYSQRGAQHMSLFYRVSAIAYPVLLCGAARASGLRWSATRVAAVYMAVRMLQGWILPLVPAEPKLGPIFYPMTHLAALEFPILLVVPALGVDWLVQRLGQGEGGPRRDLLLAPLIGVAFVLLLLVVQWPFASFLHAPAARNWFFFSDQNFVFWGRATSLYRQYQFFPGDPSTTAFIMGIARALLFATLSAFVGLSWGRWLHRVRR